MQRIKGTVEQHKGGSSLVTVYCSEIPYCARSNVTVTSNVTEVLGKCKFWVNIMPYFLWNRITAFRKVENELFYKKKKVFSSLASIVYFDMLKVEGNKRLVLSKLIMLFLLRNILYVKDHLWVVRITKCLSWVGNNRLEGFFHWSQSQTKVFWFQRQCRKLKQNLKFSWFPAVLHNPIICMWEDFDFPL